MSTQTDMHRRTNTSRTRALVGLSVLIMVVFCTFVAYQGSVSYRQAITRGEDTARRLTQTMADHVELTFLGVDLSLRRAIERQYVNALFGNNLPEYMEQNFRVWLNETPQIAALALINAKGDVEVAAHKVKYEHWLDYSQSLLGQTLFDYMKDADDRYVFIGRHTSKEGVPLIIMSRRYNTLSGEFGGVMIAALDPAYFLDFYSSIASGEEPFMALTLADGTMLSAGPHTSLLSESLVQAMVKGSGGDSKEMRVQTATSSGELQIASSVRLKNLPLLVNVILKERDVLSTWHQSRAKDIGFLALFLVFGSVLSFLAIAMARQIARAEESEEAAILASQAKSEFLANMSHELRTPLNAIIGFSEMINSGYFGPLNPKQKERIHDISLCGTHLLQLINDILEFSKGDAGKLELVEEKVDISEIVNEAARMMSGRIKAKGLNLTIGVDPDMPALWGDKRKIRQILINLISNAIKFTPDHGHIKIISTLDASRAINLIVSDTGIGMAEEDIPRALSVFGQVHRTRSAEGTGLGLPLCKMYAELHGGKLVLTSKLGEGTSVRIAFPSERTLGHKREG